MDGSTGTFDALGRRVELGSAGGYSQMVYPPFAPTYQMAGVSGLTAGSIRIPLPGGGQAIFGSAGLAQYRHPNWQGSQVLLSTPSGSPNPSFGGAFTAFGEKYAIYPSGDNGYFAGMLGVADAGAIPDAYQATARLYHQDEGRWVSPDPAGLGAVDLSNPQTMNRYAYVANNPLNFMDPSGLQDNPGPCYYDLSGEGTGTCPSVNVSYTRCGFLTGLLGISPGCSSVVSYAVSFLGQSRTGNPGSQLSIRTPGQTFTQCMSAHANDYSVAGLAQALYIDVTGKMTNAAENPLVAAVGGNAINTFFWGSRGENAVTALTNAPSAASTAMGNVTTYGRRTSVIMSLNLAATHGLPQALQSSSAAVKETLSQLGDYLGLGLSVVERLGLDAALTAAEAYNCGVR